MAGIYIHIPFCSTRCIYCDFYSQTDGSYREAYLAALIREMEMRQNYLDGQTVNTIYIGGGTPSLLPASDFERLFDALYRLFPVANPEITLEANPNDLTARYVASLSRLPFNRISIGIQSFIDGELRLLNRRHTATEAQEAVQRCFNAGMDNISIDLMYGLPGQTRDSWLSNIEKAVNLNIPHLSAYNLIYEEGTAIDALRQQGQIRPVDDDECATFFYILSEQLAKSGFIHYEVSNFARQSASYPDGRVSLHNSSYWNGGHYLGLGASAHSCNGDSRSWNIASIEEYVTSITVKNTLPAEYETLDGRMKYNDFLITRLRTASGVFIDELEKLFGEERKRLFLEQASPFLCAKTLKKQGGYVKVCSKNFFTLDSILRKLIVIQEH